MHGEACRGRLEHGLLARPGGASAAAPSSRSCSVLAGACRPSRRRARGRVPRPMVLRRPPFRTRVELQLIIARISTKATYQRRPVKQRQRRLRQRRRRHHQLATKGASPRPFKLREQRAPFQALVLAVCALAMVVVTVFSFYEMRQTRQVLARGVRTTATVVESQHHRKSPDRVVVEFTTSRGEEVSAALSDSVDARDSPVGSSLDVFYDPEQPDYVINAKITDISHHYFSIPLGIAMTIGFAGEDYTSGAAITASRGCRRGRPYANRDEPQALTMPPMVLSPGVHARSDPHRGFHHRRAVGQDRHPGQAM